MAGATIDWDAEAALGVATSAASCAGSPRLTSLHKNRVLLNFTAKEGHSRLHRDFSLAEESTSML